MICLILLPHVLALFIILLIDCWAHTGSTYGPVFETFKHWFLTNWAKYQVKNCCVSLFHFIPNNRACDASLLWFLLIIRSETQEDSFPAGTTRTTFLGIKSHFRQRPSLPFLSQSQGSGNQCQCLVFQIRQNTKVFHATGKHN